MRFVAIFVVQLVIRYGIRYGVYDIGRVKLQTVDLLPTDFGPLQFDVVIDYQFRPLAV